MIDSQQNWRRKIDVYFLCLSISFDISFIFSSMLLRTDNICLTIENLFDEMTHLKRWCCRYWFLFAFIASPLFTYDLDRVVSVDLFNSKIVQKASKQIAIWLVVSWLSWLIFFLLFLPHTFPKIHYAYNETR